MVAVDLLKQSGSQMLGTRPAARAMESAMRTMSDSGVIIFDTSGVRRIGVSFFDEALLILNEIIEETRNERLRLVYRQGPTMQSLKNLVPNRGLCLSETDAGEWVISRPTAF